MEKKVNFIAQSYRIVDFARIWKYDAISFSSWEMFAVTVSLYSCLPWLGLPIFY